MPVTFASETEVCNAALSIFGERPLNDYVTDTTKVAIECRRWLPRVITDELMKFNWPFAVERTVIAKDPTDPAYGWVSRYQVPSDCVRFLEPTKDGESAGVKLKHEVEGGFILLDQTDDLKLRYIRDQPDVTGWDYNFQKVVVAALALALVENVTGLSSHIQTVTQRYTRDTEGARRFESMQSPEMPEQYLTSWIEDRY